MQDCSLFYAGHSTRVKGGAMKYTIEDIKKLVATSKYNYDIDPWFFVADLIPHSPKLQYSCRKLYERGLLDRNERCGYGYQYRIIDQTKEDET